MCQHGAGAVIDEVLELLEDKQPHKPDEVAKRLALPIDIIEEVFSFLEERGWVEYDRDKGARITESGQRFLSLPT